MADLDRQQAIRAVVRTIPRGRVATYGAVAEAAGLVNGARQVGKALGSGVHLPWHRVLAAGGRIALPGEAGLEQRFLLESEGVRFTGRKVRMADHEHQFPRRRSKR
jgi:methylated-DNA-protein-cysteine methyltransferase-like protein